MNSFFSFSIPFPLLFVFSVCYSICLVCDCFNLANKSFIHSFIGINKLSFLQDMINKSLKTLYFPFSTGVIERTIAIQLILLMEIK